MGLVCSLTRNFEKLICKSQLLSLLCENYYNKVVDREINFCGICSNDSVLCIGGGSVPCTAIEIAKKTGASVFVIDCDQAAVSNARKVIDRLNLQGKVNVELGNGEFFNLDRFSVVHVAKQVYPKDSVLKNIWNSAKNGTKIIVRNPKAGISSLYSVDGNEMLFNDFNVSKLDDIFSETRLFIKDSEGVVA